MAPWQGQFCVGGQMYVGSMPVKYLFTGGSQKTCHGMSFKVRVLRLTVLRTVRGALSWYSGHFQVTTGIDTESQHSSLL